MRDRHHAYFTAIVTSIGVFFACSASQPNEASDRRGGGLGGGGAVGSAAEGGSGASAGTQALGSGGMLGIDIDASDPLGCVNLQCQQTTCTVGSCTQQPCADGASTTVSGVVYDPAGKLPLYNVVVYVPNSAVEPLPAGASCDRCAASIQNALVSTLTDTEGKFALQDVPVGSDIPLVIQVGKWRRQVTIPSVAACAETALTDTELTRLPRTQSEGDLPLIAIATGGADSMECLPRRLGVADSEFTSESGSGRIHLYGGRVSDNGDTPTTAFDTTLNAGATLTSATTLWSDLEQLKKYDIVILSCEGPIADDAGRPAAAQQAIYDYLALGGRVLASHWHHIWFSGFAALPNPLPPIGTWQDRTEPEAPSLGLINTTFPKGEAFASWLVNVDASASAGQITITVPRDNIQAVDTTYAQDWISTTNTNVEPDGPAVQYLSFNAPLTVPEEEKCGRGVFTDLHVSSTGGDTPSAPFPTSCEVRDLSAEEKAVSFMLFDLSSCIQADDEPPMPPK